MLLASFFCFKVNGTFVQRFAIFQNSLTRERRTFESFRNFVSVNHIARFLKICFFSICLGQQIPSKAEQITKMLLDSIKYPSLDYFKELATDMFRRDFPEDETINNEKKFQEIGNILSDIPNRYELPEEKELEERSPEVTSEFFNETVGTNIGFSSDESDNENEDTSRSEGSPRSNVSSNISSAPGSSRNKLTKEGLHLLF